MKKNATERFNEHTARNYTSGVTRPQFRLYVPPKLFESVQRRIDEYRAIPSLKW